MNTHLSYSSLVPLAQWLGWSSQELPHFNRKNSETRSSNRLPQAMNSGLSSTKGGTEKDFRMAWSPSRDWGVESYSSTKGQAKYAESLWTASGTGASQDRTISPPWSVDRVQRTAICSSPNLSCVFSLLSETPKLCCSIVTFKWVVSQFQWGVNSMPSHHHLHHWGRENTLSRKAASISQLANISRDLSNRVHVKRSDFWSASSSCLTKWGNRIGSHLSKAQGR